MMANTMIPLDVIKKGIAEYLERSVFADIDEAMNSVGYTYDVTKDGTVFRVSYRKKVYVDVLVTEIDRTKAWHDLIDGLRLDAFINHVWSMPA